MVSIESVRVHVYCQHYIFFIHFFITKGFIRTLSAPSPFVVGIGTVRAEMADNTVSIGEDRRLRKASVKVLNSLRGVAAFRRFDKIAHHSEMQEDMLREMFFSYDSIHNGRLAVADLYELLRMVRTSGGASQSLASIAEVPDGKDEGRKKGNGKGMYTAFMGHIGEMAVAIIAEYKHIKDQSAPATSAPQCECLAPELGPRTWSHLDQEHSGKDP